jgi:hypothetical protein
MIDLVEPCVIALLTSIDHLHLNPTNPNRNPLDRFNPSPSSPKDYQVDFIPRTAEIDR